ncbi:MAG: hypothetical protein PVF17_08590 [Ignavibacteria bacterium]|jgi:hypothetical protein
MNKLLLLALFITISYAGFAQNHFANFEFLIGDWQGVETGVAGDGIGFRTYKYELNKNYIFSHNQSTFPISEKKPRGEVHRDISVMSFNSNDSSIVLREFHVEGFTNIYLLNEEYSEDNKFVFITREIENNPGGWAARLIIEKISDTEFIEYFDIAMDGKNFSPFLKNHWQKVD